MFAADDALHGRVDELVALPIEVNAVVGAAVHIGEELLVPPNDENVPGARAQRLGKVSRPSIKKKALS